MLTCSYGEKINGEGAIKSAYANEAPIKYLIEKAKNDAPEEKIKVIFLISKKVYDEKIFNDDFSVAERDSETGCRYCRYFQL